MFIPFVIPTSVRTHKKWIIDIMNTPFLGGYLIMLIALLPPFIGGLILSAIISSISSILSQNYWILAIFLSGIIVFFWDKWLKSAYETEIKLIYIPIEYFAYIIITITLIIVYV
ncbi:MAG: hypothetical protein ABH896_01180 [Candidatus Jacksonbacteria bacterium]